jgi:hypothetical protein
MVLAHETVEGPRGDVGGEAGSLVRNIELGARGRSARADHDFPFAVTKRVVDEVAEGLAQAQRVGAHPLIPVGSDLDRAALLLGPIHEAIPYAVQQGANVERLAPHRQLPLAGAGDDKQVLGELSEAVALLDGGD